MKEWRRFVLIHSLEEGQTIAFNHQGNRVFDVVVFNTTWAALEAFSDRDSSEEENDSENDEDSDEGIPEENDENGSRRFEVVVRSSGWCNYHTQKLVSLCIPIHACRAFVMLKKRHAKLKISGSRAKGCKVEIKLKAKWGTSNQVNQGTVWFKKRWWEFVEENKIEQGDKLTFVITGETRRSSFLMVVYVSH